MLTSETNLKDSLVSFSNHQGRELRGTLLRLTRFKAAFEVYNAADVLRLSEVLDQFRIVFQDRTIYSGRAVVSGLVSTGLTTVCEASLNEESWMDVNVGPSTNGHGVLREEFSTFIEEWQKLYKVSPDFKIVVADMQTFFADLRLWLDQVELGIRAMPSGDRLQLEQSVAEELAGPVVESMNCLFERFETIANQLEDKARYVHGNYMRRQLHPWVMCAPFAYRTFHKPLGYAGDYEMVNMIARAGQEGGSLYAKIVNTWFLRQLPAKAHRNRIQYLAEKLLTETARLNPESRYLRTLDVACGPAQELQKFLIEHPASSRLAATLLDFNEETLGYVREALTDIRQRHGRGSQLQFVKKSIHQILKESGRTLKGDTNTQYDFICCAGLFDYLTDPICKRLMGIMFEWLAPGGLLIATNVDPSNPLRHGMEHLLDWHLQYRTGSEMRLIKPEQSSDDLVNVCADSTGVNIFLEVRKPNHA